MHSYYYTLPGNTSNNFAFLIFMTDYSGRAVAQFVEVLHTRREVPGSFPGEILGYFLLSAFSTALLALLWRGGGGGCPSCAECQSMDGSPTFQSFHDFLGKAFH